MADNYGLLTGLAQGLAGGINNYLNVTGQLQERKRQQQQQQAELLSKGLIQNSDTGEITLSPEKQLERQYTSEQYDPNSSLSKRTRETAKSLFTKFGIDQAVPEDASAAELQNGLLGKALSGEYGAMGRQVTAQRMADRNDIMLQQLRERQNVNASHAGQAFEKDPILSQTKKTNNSLDRALSLLNGKEPITAKSFAVLQQDFINAMAPGGAATEGKVNREMVETAQGALNDLKLRYGNVSDLRKEQPQIVQNLRNLINQVKSDYSKAQAQQALDIYGSFENTTNPQTLKTLHSKKDRYVPQGYESENNNGLLKPSQLSGEDQQALEWANANPNDKRAIAIKQRLGM